MENDYRLEYDFCRARLRQRLEEPAPSRIQLLTGPRQVGKTTLLLDLTRELGERALYAAGDSPESTLPGSWERLWADAEERAGSKGSAVLFLDEVQHFNDWAARLKGEWDRLRRHKIALHVVATGSSALRLGAGSRESLAGRFERLSLTHWSASGIARAFRIPPSEAAELFVQRGSYPGALSLRSDHARWSAYVRDAIVEPAIGRDILALADVRRPGLLRQVFAVATSLPAQIVSLQKIQGQLRDAGAMETIVHYLELLKNAYLVAALEKHSDRPARRRAAPPKLVPLNNALLAAVDPRGIPDSTREPERFGTWVENACLAFAWNSGQQVTYWREEPFEVDGILEGSWGRWAVEVKTGRFDPSRIRGLLEFTRRKPSFRPLVLCEPRERRHVERTGIQAIPWSDFLLNGPPGPRNP